MEAVKPFFETIDITGLSKEQWLELRRGYIGGSDAAAVVGMSKWRSPYELALDKLGALPVWDGQSEAAYWGSRHEANIIDHLLSLPEFEGWTSVSTKDEMYVSTVYPWASANLDHLLIDPSGLLVGVEAKSGSEYTRDGWVSGTIGEGGDAPIPYQLQTHHYMAVRPDIAYFLVPALIGGNKFYLVKIPRDSEMIDNLMKHEAAFAKMVSEHKVPNPSGSERDYEIMATLHESPEGDVELDLECLDLAKIVCEARERVNAAKEEQKQATNLLMAKLGDAKRGTLPGYVVNRTKYDTEPYTVPAGHKDYITVKEVKA